MINRHCCNFQCNYNFIWILNQSTSSAYYWSVGAVDVIVSRSKWFHGLAGRAQFVNKIRMTLHQLKWNFKILQNTFRQSYCRIRFDMFMDSEIIIIMWTMCFYVANLKLRGRWHNLLHQISSLNKKVQWKPYSPHCTAFPLNC